MANYLTTDADLTSVADAIREKGGTSAALAFPAGFVDAIGEIQTGGTDALAKRCEGTLTSYESDMVTTITHSAFRDASELLAIKVHNCRQLVGGYLFYATKLSNIAFPNLISVGLQSFSSIGATLNSIDLGENLTTISQLAFSPNANFKALILRSPAVPSLGNINAFNGTPFASGGAGGTLYVPAALISAYQSATNWSTILGYANNAVLPIEGSIYETQYADGTPIS